MKKMWVWIAVNVGLVVLVVPGSIVEFGHFWQKWEFLSAAAAAAYNLFFTIVVFATSSQLGGKTLHQTLQNPFNVICYLILRVSLPSIFFGIGAGVIWGDRTVPHGMAVDSNDILLKLVLTFGAFAAVFVGDMMTEHHLRTRRHASDADAHWARHLKRHAFLIDLPLVVGYFGLILIYLGHRSTMEDELLLQAFVGGASALEMLVLTAVHGFAEFADHETRSIFSLAPDSSPSL